MKDTIIVSGCEDKPIPVLFMDYNGESEITLVLKTDTIVVDYNEMSLHSS